jgi:hypothetical protein
MSNSNFEAVPLNKLTTMSRTTHQRLLCCRLLPAMLLLFGLLSAVMVQWGTTAAEKALYEMNAKDLITLWGDQDCPLNEYAAVNGTGC